MWSDLPANRMTWPVTFSDNGLSRYVTSGAIRSGVLSGVQSVVGSAAAIRVHANGHTAFARTPKSTRSIAHDTVIDATAPFDAEYVPAPRCPNRESDAMFTIAPPRCACILLMAAVPQYNGPRTLTSINARIRSASSSHGSAACRRPALLTKPSIGPNSATPGR
jgi:hypothetical protein